MKRSRSAARAGLLASAATVAVAVTLAAPAGLAAATPKAGLTTPPPGTITTIAGGIGGPGPAPLVSLLQAPGCFGLGVSAGQLYVSGWGADRTVSVRTGQLTTIGQQVLTLTGFTGFSNPDDGLAPGPCPATRDSFGNLIVPERGLQVIAATSGRFYGQPMTAGQAYRLMPLVSCAGSTGLRPCAADVTIDHWGNVVASLSATVGPHPRPPGIDVTPARSGTYYGVRMTVGHTYHLVSGGGGQVAPDRFGNLLVAGDGLNRVGVVAGMSGRFYGQAMKAGKLYDLAGSGSAGFAGDGRSARKAKLSGPQAVAVDRSGNVVIGDTGNKRVRVVAERSGRFYGLPMKAGDIYTVIGNASPAARAHPVAATAVAVDGSENLLTFDGTLVRALAAKPGRFYGRQMRAGHVYTVAGNASGHPGDGGPATNAQFQFLFGMTIDGAGNIVQTADFGVRVVAEQSGTFYGQKMTAGDVYTIAGDGSEEFSGDGGPALKAGMWPDGVVVDSTGNLVIADGLNDRVRVLAVKSGTFYGQQMTAGDIYTIAGSDLQTFSGDGGPAVDAGLDDPAGMTFDPAGNLLIADLDSGRVRVVAATTGTFYGQSMTAGDIYSIAGVGLSGLTGNGVPATQASLAPAAVTFDKDGNLLIADGGRYKLRVVAESTGTFYGQPMTAGDIYTVIGTQFGTDGPADIAVDGAGNLIAPDAFHGRIRVLAQSTGAFYGRSMTAGHVYTIAGGGTNGLGDGGPGIDAAISPVAVAIDANGDLVITDQDNGRIRLLTH